MQYIIIHKITGFLFRKIKSRIQFSLSSIHPLTTLSFCPYNCRNNIILKQLGWIRANNAHFSEKREVSLHTSLKLKSDLPDNAKKTIIIITWQLYTYLLLPLLLLCIRQTIVSRARYYLPHLSRKSITEIPYRILIIEQHIRTYIYILFPNKHLYT